MNKKGLVVWITGLSGSGKTTIAKKIIRKLKVHKPIHLDGDDLREILNIKGKTTFSKKNREKIGLIYSKFANYLANQGNFVIVSVMALNNSTFYWNKKNIKNFRLEFNKLWVHGLVHLFGHDHKKDKDFIEMLKVEKKFLSYLY